MSRKLIKRTAVLIFLIVSALLTVSAIGKISKEKIDSASLKAVSFMKTNYNADTAVSGLDISFFPPEISIKKVQISRNGKELAALEKCSIGELHKLFLSEEKKLKINCKNSRIYAPVLLSMRHDPDNSAVKNEDTADKENSSNADGSVSVKKEKNRKPNLLNTAVSVYFTSDSEIVLGSITRRFKTELTFSLPQSKGALHVSESGGSGSGTAEIHFSLKEKTASVRLDSMDIAGISEILKHKTAVEISNGTISSFSEISEKEGKILLENDITVNDLTFFHPLIDSKPFTIPLFRFKGALNLDKNEKYISTKEADISLSGMHAVFSGTYSKDMKEFSIKTDSVKLNKLETLIHDETFKGYLFGGTLELFAEYYRKGDEEPAFSIVGNLVEPKQLSDRMDYLKSTFEYAVANKDGTKKHIVVGERNPNFTPIALIPDHLIWAVIVSEDAGFFIHKGVDFQELDAAVKDNIKKHKMRGGSTITQQLAKNLFLSRDKTLMRKFREVLLSIELDATLSKERLLEIYLNIVEWAPGVFGIARAAEHYFGKQPFELTPLESAYLASVIPGPAKYHYQFLTKNVSENWYKSLYRILNIMNETGHLSTAEYLKAVRQTVVFREPEE